MSAWTTPEIDDDVALGMAIIGAGIRAGRHALQLTQEQFGELVGLSQSAISRLETGTLHGLRFRRLARIVGTVASSAPGWAFPAGLARSAPLLREDKRRG